MLISWMRKILAYRICLVSICFAISTIIGCGDDELFKEPSIQVIPLNYDFGIVTSNNMPAPLEIKIQNNSRATLIVFDIALADTINFILDLSGGENPCNTSSPNLLKRRFCTVEIDFQPGSDDTFNTILSIRSTAKTPLVNVDLSGISEQITALEVKINQVDSTDRCPNPTDVTAYVSVTDQGGYSVAGLLKANFLVAEDGLPININDFFLRTVSQAPLSPLSVTVAMDYSSSIIMQQDVLDDMEENVSEFINQLAAADEAEIIKFGGLVPVVVQEFTSDRAELTSAIFAPFDQGPGTPIYDALILAVNDTALGSGDRKVVIVVTDGEDNSSSATIADAISNAQTEGIPIFTVGIGNFNRDFLQQMSDQTGGIFYEADNSDNTRTVFQQLANLLFIDQYVLTYVTSLSTGDTADFEIEATLNLITGDDAEAITPCP